MLARAGKPEVGRKLIEEAAEATAKLGAADPRGYARRAVAKALALFDLERALALIEPIKERNDRDSVAAAIIEAIARSNPERALSAGRCVGSQHQPAADPEDRDCLRDRFQPPRPGDPDRRRDDRGSWSPETPGRGIRLAGDRHRSQGQSQSLRPDRPGPGPADR